MQRRRPHGLGKGAVINYSQYMLIQIKNQKGFGMKLFQNLFGYKLTYPYRISFYWQSLIAEFLQHDIGAEPSEMPL